MSFGLTTQGFNPASLDDVRSALETALKAEFGNNIPLHDESVWGQLVGVFADQFAKLWEAAEDTYSAGYIGSATGTSLDDLVALGGVIRDSGSLSVVTLTIAGTSGTTIPSLSQFRDPATNTIWATTANAVIPGGGSVDVIASPLSVGPIIALAGTVTEIVVPISGVDSVTNAADSTPGRSPETDAALRLRFVSAFRSGGGSSDEAIRAVLLQVEGVTEAFVVSNRSDVTDAGGRPPHSLEAVVRGGVNQDILDALWVSIPAGIQPYGLNVSGTVTDSRGNPQSVSFTRPVNVNIYIRIAYEPEGDADVDVIEASVVSEVVNHGTTLNTGGDVLPFQFKQSIETSGIRRLAFFVGTGPGPTSEDEVVIDPRELASIDSTRISFTRVVPGADLV